MRFITEDGATYEIHEDKGETFVRRIGGARDSASERFASGEWALLMNDPKVALGARVHLALEAPSFAVDGEGSPLHTINIELYATDRVSEVWA